MFQFMQSQCVRLPVHRLFALFFYLANDPRPFLFRQRIQNAQQNAVAEFEICQQVGKRKLSSAELHGYWQEFAW
jgi:hypothetical protein